MEQPCYKCSQAVREGQPFCPSCGAAQIRVLTVEPAPAIALSEAVVGGDGTISMPATETVPVLAVPVQWPQAIKPCLLASFIATLLMLLGLTPLVAMFSAGFLAVLFYRQGRPGNVMKAATGARLGAFGGLLAFGISTAIAAVTVAVPQLRVLVQAQMTEQVQKWAAAHPGDSQMQAALEQLKTPEGLIVAGLVWLILSVILGGLGGSLAGLIFGRKNS